MGLKTYSSNEISNLPKQIIYEKDGYVYTYDLIECPSSTFNGIGLPNDDIITKWDRREGVGSQEYKNFYEFFYERFKDACENYV